MTKEYLIHDMYNAEWPLQTRLSLFAQQFIVSITSYVVLEKIGYKLYRFDDHVKSGLKFWDGLLDRYQSLRWDMWDAVFSCEDKRHEMLAFIEKCMTPILKCYGRLLMLQKI
jgi:hypothetical protein